MPRYIVTGDKEVDNPELKLSVIVYGVDTEEAAQRATTHLPIRLGTVLTVRQISDLDTKAYAITLT